LSENRLGGKRILVTGATAGIGKAIVERSVAEEMRVIASGRNQTRLEELRAQFPDLSVIKADLSQGNEAVDLANRAIECYNGIDVLINNAGLGIKGNVTELSSGDLDTVLNVNLKAPFILSKIVGKSMSARGDGYIINIGSGASTTPIAGYASYCASKYGLLGFSESLALEMRNSGVEVSIVMPGSTATSFGGSNKDQRLNAKPGILHAEDVVDAVFFLLNQPKHAWTSQMNLRPLDPMNDFNS